MGSFPITYHLGPLTVSAYGIGLALTFWFAYRYTERRLRRRGLPSAWLGRSMPWIVVAAIVGARAASVFSNWSAYRANPLAAVSFWHGGLAGLSSFGGLVLALPTGLWLLHRRGEGLGVARALDIAVPALVAAWGLGRLLACQFMVGAGGPRTTAWYGLAYAGQAGRRVPVPLFQSMENWVIFAVLIVFERRFGRRGGPAGIVAALGVSLWGAARASDEWLFFLHPGQAGSIGTSLGGVALFAGGLAAAAWLLYGNRSPSPDAPSLPPPDTEVEIDAHRAPTNLDPSAVSIPFNDSKPTPPR